MIIKHVFFLKMDIFVIMNSLGDVKMTKKISIIIPVYNAEKYLERCLMSIIDQSYQDFEIILINDGSTDNSLNICNQFSEKDKRIKVYTKKNGGVSSARNYGIKKVITDYVCFIDSDDFISNDYLIILYSNIYDTNSDISVCGFIKYYKDEQVGDQKIQNKIIFDKKSAYDAMISNKQYAGYVWNKLYKFEIIKRMGDEIFKGNMFEDFEFNCRYLNECKKIVYTPTQLYYYFINDSSVTGTFTINDRIISGIDLYYSILNKYDQNNIDSSDLVAYVLLKYMYNLKYRAHKLNYPKDVIIDNQIYKRVMKSNIISFKNKILIFITSKNPIFIYSLKYKFKKSR